MGLDREEEVVVLYALHKCGGRGRKARIIYYIVENNLMKPREGDNEVRENRERKIENDLAWARENLKEKNQLIMPEHGIWQITELGKERLFRVARKVCEKPPDASWFTRYSDKFLSALNELGKQVSASAPALVTVPSASAARSPLP